MVPIETFTSILPLPSSGSNKQTYFDCILTSSSNAMKSSISSLPIPAQLIPCRRAPANWLLANTSSFFTSSPRTLIAPASPNISTRPALFTSTFTLFAARPMSRSKPLSSPVARGNNLNCCMVNSSRVRTFLLMLFVRQQLWSNKNSDKCKRLINFQFPLKATDESIQIRRRQR